MADTKLKDLSEISVPALDDLLYTVDDPAGTPVSNKLTVARAMGNWRPSICEGRLSLASGFPVYNPQPKTPSSTDTGTEVATFGAAHGWVTGTMIRPYATVGGLTINVTYYIRALSTTTCAFYTTLANAIADTSRVNLTASITQLLVPFGIQNTTLYFAPYNGDRVALYDGTRWKLSAFTERSLALTLTAGNGYDVWLYDNAGTLTLETLIWTSPTVRATEWVLQDGIKVKSGDPTRRLVGSFYVVATNTIEDSKLKRHLWNNANRVLRGMNRIEPTATWNYTLTAFQQANASAANQLEVFRGLDEDAMTVNLLARAANAGAVVVWLGIGLDSATAISDYDMTGSRWNSGATSVAGTAQYAGMPGVGYHFLTWLEASAASGTTTWGGFATGVINSGMTGQVMA